VAEIEEQALQAGQSLSDVDNVLMVGGSTLLPDVYPAFEQRFGRQKVRAWQPFEAVAYGAAAFSAGEFASSDFIVHDYAFVTHDPRTHEPTYTTIVPAGTRFPTKPDHWKRQLVPTCALGVPEKLFKLVVCELGGQQSVHRRFGWDEEGRVHDLSDTNEGPAYVVKLNESSPTLGFLNPAHEPDDRRPRLEIGFGVNAERWLIATVKDLKTGKQLLQQSPVVRLV
jgi:hypothetical protein